MAHAGERGYRGTGEMAPGLRLRHSYCTQALKYSNSDLSSGGGGNGLPRSSSSPLAAATSETGRQIQNVVRLMSQNSARIQTENVLPEA